MANSKYEYVRDFEQPDVLLQNTWIVVRIDGRGFHKFSAKYNFEKPNDVRALRLMNEAARSVMQEIHEIVFAYGISDEYSFVLHPSCQLFQRRASKLITTIVSTFTAYYVHLWPQFMVTQAPAPAPATTSENSAEANTNTNNTATPTPIPLSPPLPSFDGRAVCYPTLGNIRDYLAWRQVDCHINNLYNTAFWTLVLKGGRTTQEAEKELSGTVASDKNEILFKLGINYNNEPEIYKKGSVLFREYQLVEAPSTGEPGDAAEPQQSQITDVPVTMSKSAAERERKARAKAKVVVEHLDIIRDEFWNKRPWILSGRPGKLPT